MEKLKKAIQQGNHEGARIYGQDAIREKNQALNHLRMASRLDACCSRIETAVRMNQVSSGMKGVVKGMDKSLASMNIDQLSAVMDKFEAQFEDLDVKVCSLSMGEGCVCSTFADLGPMLTSRLLSRICRSISALIALNCVLPYLLDPCWHSTQLSS